MPINLSPGRPALRCFPSKVFVIVGNEEVDIRKTVQVTFLTAVPPESVQVVSDGRLPLHCEAELVSSGEYVIELRASRAEVASLGTGLHEGEIRIEPSSPGEFAAVHIPVSVFVKPL